MKRGDGDDRVMTRNRTVLVGQIARKEGGGER